MSDIKQIISLPQYNNLMIIAQKNNMNVDSLLSKIILEFLNQNKSQYETTKVKPPISRDLSKGPIRREPVNLITRIKSPIINPETVDFLFCFALFDFVNDDAIGEWELVTGYENAFIFLKEYVEDNKEYMIEETLEKSFVLRSDRNFEDKMTLHKFCKEASKDFNEPFDLDFYSDDDEESEEDE